MFQNLYRSFLTVLLLAVTPAVQGDGGTDSGNNVTLGTAAGINLDTDGSGDDAFSNTMIGVFAGTGTTTGDDNTFVGMGAGVTNTTGSSNTFIGKSTGFNSTGNANTFVGFNAGLENTAGNLNTFIGSSAGLLNTGGIGNTFVGDLAGGSHDTGNNNTFLGRSAGQLNTSGANNVFVGQRAGQNELGSSRLYIESSSSSTPLIYGEFDDDIVAINDTLGVGTQLPTSPLHVRRAAGTALIKVEAGGDADQGEQAGFQFINGAFGNPGVHSWDMRPGGVGNLIFNYNGGPVEFTYQTDGDLVLGGTLTELSSRSAKQDIEPVNGVAILEKVLALRLSRWTYKHDRDRARHLGPMAEDFAAAFGLGATETGITPIDSAGVALAAIQGLKAEKDRELAEKDAEIQALKDELADMRKLVESFASNGQVAMVQ